VRKVVQDPAGGAPDDQQLEPADPGSETPSSARSPLRYGKRVVLLLLAGASLYLLLPSLLAVFGSWRSLERLDWPFAVGVLVCEVASYAWLWQLDRIALRTKGWFPVATAQLSGNLAGLATPAARRITGSPPTTRSAHSSRSSSDAAAHPPTSVATTVPS
jgi:hypothetical protein